MSDYQVFARKYRPQKFSDVLGQDAAVATLKNMIKRQRLAHAYLFCGSKGTGKTTLARLLAKALNCENLSEDQEPCNSCASCKEIMSGVSIDIIEIDGASNRGIDDMRKINETVGYATAMERFKIIIIDEVHMLTKEAFNALLKTLEEPPPKAKFFFATTEPHKVLPTILSRCQRFNLRRIGNKQIVSKLRRIADELSINVDEEALYLIAERAEGGLRDAESLFDQLCAFHEGNIDIAAVNTIFGIAPRALYFEIDEAGHKGEYAKAFDIVERLFTEGKDLSAFIDGLVEHYRNLLVVKLAGNSPTQLPLMPKDREGYTASSSFYTQEQCMMLLDHLINVQERFRFAPSPRIFLETLLLYLMRSHRRIPVELLVQRLEQLEKGVGEETAQVQKISEEKPKPQAASAPKPKPQATQAQKPQVVSTPKPKPPTAPASKPESEQSSNYHDAIKRQSKYDTLLQFAAVELGGSLQKKS